MAAETLAGVDRCFRPERTSCYRLQISRRWSDRHTSGQRGQLGRGGWGGNEASSISHLLPRENGADDDRYSMRIRQDLSETLRGRESEGIVFTEERSNEYRTEIADADFCPVAPGDGWSARFEDAVVAGCIPVVFQDEILTPWEGWLDVSKYSLRFSRAEIKMRGGESLVEKLRAIPLETRDELRLQLARVWHRTSERASSRDDEMRGWWQQRAVHGRGAEGGYPGARRVRHARAGVVSQTKGGICGKTQI